MPKQYFEWNDKLLEIVYKAIINNKAHLFKAKKKEIGPWINVINEIAVYVINKPNKYPAL